MSRYKMNDDDFSNEFIDSNYDNYHRELENEFWELAGEGIAQEYREAKPHLIAHIKQELERLAAPDFGCLDTPEKRAKFILEEVENDVKRILYYNLDIDILTE